MNKYLIGGAIRFTVTFRDFAGDLADPTTVVFKVKAPSDLVNSILPAVVRFSLGMYYADFVPTEAGEHMWHWAGTGGSITAAVDEGIFDVYPSKF